MEILILCINFEHNKFSKLKNKSFAFLSESCCSLTQQFWNMHRREVSPSWFGGHHSNDY